MTNDPISKAVALIFQVHDTDWCDALVACLRNADMDAFRTALIAEHERRWEEFYAKHPSARPGNDS
jgi:hypothetical protein